MNCSLVWRPESLVVVVFRSLLVKLLAVWKTARFWACVRLLEIFDNIAIKLFYNVKTRFFLLLNNRVI